MEKLTMTYQQAIDRLMQPDVCGRVAVRMPVGLASVITTKENARVALELSHVFGDPILIEFTDSHDMADAPITCTLGTGEPLQPVTP